MNSEDRKLIIVLITGGTIDCDSIHPETQAYSFRESKIPKMLEQTGVDLPISHEVLMRKDSLLMTEEDRRAILRRCQSCEEKLILITHGTDTMAETAAVIGNAVTDKVIVLTGSMIPFNQPDSDAMFNLGTALAHVQTLPSGTYISMNGRIFSYDNVRKNVELRRFESLRD